MKIKRKYKLLIVVILLILFAVVILLFPDTLIKIGPWQEFYQIDVVMPSV